MKVKSIFMVMEKPDSYCIEPLYELEDGKWVMWGHIISEERAKAMLKNKPQDLDQITYYKDIIYVNDTVETNKS